MKSKLVRNSKKMTVFVASVALAAAVLAGCGDTGSTNTNETDDASSALEEEQKTADNSGTQTVEVTLKMGHGLPASGMAGQTYAKFAELVSELSNGSMEVEIHSDGTLISDTDCFDSVMSGTIDFTHDAVNRESGTIPDIAPLEIPGYFASDTDTWLQFAEDLREPLDELYADYNIKYIAANYQGTSVFVSNGVQIKKPDDVKGKSVRAIGTWLSKAVESWGGAAVSLGLADLPNGLERGTVDAAYTAWSVAIPNSLYEVSDYITYTNMCETYACLLMNLDSWNGLTAEQQDVLIEAGKQFEEYSVELANEMEEQGKQTAADNGCEVYSLTEEEKAAFVDAVEPLFDECASSLTDKGQKILDIINSYK